MAIEAGASATPDVVAIWHQLPRVLELSATCSRVSVGCYQYEQATYQLFVDGFLCCIDALPNSMKSNLAGAFSRVLLVRDDYLASGDCLCTAL
jgi:hypothetical protein